MLTRPQQILLKRAQRESGLDDADYREAIETVSAMPGCRSSKDVRLTDEHLDKLLSYLEAIFWHKADLAGVQPDCKPDAIFRQRRFWAQKNTRAETSRDRFVDSGLRQEIAAIEAKLQALGFGPRYCAAIKTTAIGDREDVPGLYIYRAAIQRTLKAKENKFADTRSAQIQRS